MTQRQNKILCDKYPFLKKYDWLGNFVGYESTWQDALPEGWKKAMCPQMWEDLKNILVKANYLNEFRFHHIRNKLGLLSFGYTGIGVGTNEKRLMAWERKYSEMSEYTCVECGDEVDYLDATWGELVCAKCAKERLKQEPETKFVKIRDLHRYIEAPDKNKPQFYTTLDAEGDK